MLAIIEVHQFWLNSTENIMLSSGITKNHMLNFSKLLSMRILTGKALCEVLGVCHHVGRRKH